MAKFRPRVSESVEAFVLQFAMVVDLGDGETMTAKKGDYIVTRSDGSQFIAKKDEFLETYEEVKKPGRKAKAAPMVEEDEDEDLEEDCEDEEEPASLPSPKVSAVPPVPRAQSPRVPQAPPTMTAKGR